jgi:hypothetical protein
MQKKQLAAVALVATNKPHYYKSYCFYFKTQKEARNT